MLGLRRNAEHRDRPDRWLEAPDLAYGDKRVNGDGGLAHVTDEGGRQQVRASKRKEVVQGSVLESYFTRLGPGRLGRGRGAGLARR